MKPAPTYEPIPENTPKRYAVGLLMILIFGLIIVIAATLFGNDNGAVVLFMIIGGPLVLQFSFQLCERHYPCYHWVDISSPTCE